MDVNLKDNNLLVLTHTYRNWVKDRIESIAGYFNKVFVLVRYKPLAKAGNLFNSHIFKMHTKNMVFDMDNIPANVNVIPIPVYYLPTDKGYLKLGKKHYNSVKKIIKKKNIKFDIIHAHFLWSAGFVGDQLKKDYSVPLVVTAHAYDVYDLPFRSDTWKTGIKKILSNTDHVITVCNKNVEYIKSINMNSPISVIPSGYRNHLFHKKNIMESRIKLNLPIDKKIILTVGNLVEVKGHTYLIDSMKDIVNLRKDVICIIVGEGKLKMKLAKKIKLNKLKNNVLIKGYRKRNEIVDWLNACDVFVLPSLNEGSPTVLFESLACGKPFVGTTVGGIPEYITSHDYGILVKPKNSKLLAKALLEALERDWDSRLIIEHSKNYDWEILSKEKIHIYNELINGN